MLRDLELLPRVEEQRNKKDVNIWNSQEKVDTKKALIKSLLSSILNGGFIF